MSSLNKVMFIGNLGQDPVLLKNTENGCFVRLSLATSKKYYNARNELIEDIQWHEVYANNGTGKYVMTYAQKGTKIYIEGEQRTKMWTDKKGVTRYLTSVYAQTCNILSKGKNEAENNEDVCEVSSSYEMAKHAIEETLLAACD